MINDTLQSKISALLVPDRQGGASITWSPVGGGSINRSFRVESGGKSLFVKLNDADAYPGMFEAEAKGLKMLSEHSRFKVPSVIGCGIEHGTAYIAMSFIDGGHRSKSFWQNFAHSTARMHQHTHQSFGLNHNNFIGSLTQQNDERSDWSSFYAEMRLEPQLRLATDNGIADQELRRRFDRLFNRLDTLFPSEQPALIHGDLWSGNFMCTKSGEATIYDPAVYYGHREMDLAMSKLFGGFDDLFYHHYQQTFPLEQGWTERIPIGQLYPLLVHVNLFGRGYLPQVKACLKPFV